MRLTDIKRQLFIAEEKFKPQFSNDSYGYYIKNVLSTKDALRILKDCGFFPVSGYDFSEQFYQIISSSFTDRIIVDSNQYKNFSIASDRIKYMIVSLCGWLSGYITDEEDENTISIKLPNIDYISDLSLVIDMLEKSLSSISVINGGGEIKVKQVEHGSIWVVIAVCSVRIVKAIAVAVNSALDIAKKKVELDLAKETLRKSQIENQALENLVSLQKELIRKLIEEESNNLEDVSSEEANGLTSSERRNRYRKALSELTDLVMSGTEFHPAVSASRDIIEQFPNFTKQGIVLKSPVAKLPRNNEIEKYDTKLNDEESKE